MTQPPSIDLQEILDQMDELGRAKFDAALERVKSAKLQARVDELEARERDSENQRGANVSPKQAERK